MKLLRPPAGIPIKRISAAKKALGAALVVLGFLALLTPLTPGAWLMFIGMEILGVRLLSREKISSWWRRLRNRRVE